MALLTDDGHVALWAWLKPPVEANKKEPAGDDAAKTDKQEKPAEPTERFIEVPLSEPVQDGIALAFAGGDVNRLFVGKKDNQIIAFTIGDGKLANKWKSPAPLLAIAAHPNHKQVATLGNDGITRSWNVADGKELSNLLVESSTSRSLNATQRDAARQQAEIDRLTASVKELEAAHKKEEEALKKVADEREKLAAALATKTSEEDANAKAIKDAEAGIAEAKKMIEEQNKRITQLTADIEAKKKKEPELAAAKQTAMEQVKKQDQTLATSKESVERAAKAIPAQQAVVETVKQKLVSIQSKAQELTTQVQSNHQDAAVSLRFSSTGNALVIARQAGTITVVDTAGNGVSAELKLPNKVRSVSATAKTLIAAGAGTSLTTWNLSSDWKLDRVIGSETDPASLLSDRVTALAFSPDGKTLAIGSGPASRFGDIKLVNVRDGSVTKDFGEVHSDTVLDLAFSPDGTQLASSGADKLVRIFDLNTGKQRLSLEGHTHHVLSIAWQDSGHVLASASADGTIKVWDTNSGEQQRTVSGFSKEITSVSFVGTTSQLIAACADQSVRLVETKNGQTVRTYTGAGSALYATCVMSTSKHLLAGGQDGQLLMWETEKPALLKKLE